MKNDKVLRISDNMKHLVQSARDDALSRIAMLGIAPGAKVRRFRFDGTPDGDYIVARIDTKYGLWIYGYKCRVDGTVGNHQHPVGNAWEVEVIQ